MSFKTTSAKVAAGVALSLQNLFTSNLRRGSMPPLEHVEADKNALTLAEQKKKTKEKKMQKVIMKSKAFISGQKQIHALVFVVGIAPREIPSK